MIQSFGAASTFYHYGFSNDVSESVLSLNPSIQLDGLGESSKIESPNNKTTQSNYLNPQHIIQCRTSLCGTKIAIMTGQTIVIFSAGPHRVLLNRLERSLTTRLYGSYRLILWSTDGMRLYVLTESGNYLCMYRFVNIKDYVNRLNVSNSEHLNGVPRFIIVCKEMSTEDVNQSIYADVLYEETNETVSDDYDLSETDHICPINTKKKHPMINGTQWQGIKSPNYETLLYLNDYKKLRKKANQYELIFDAVIQLPYITNDIQLSLDQVLFGCRYDPVIFLTSNHPYPININQYIYLKDFLLKDKTSWISCRSIPSRQYSTQSSIILSTDFLLFSEYPTNTSIASYLQSFPLCHSMRSTLLTSSIKDHHIIKQNNDSTSHVILPSSFPNQYLFNDNGIQHIELNESLDVLGVVLSSGAGAIFAWKQPFSSVSSHTLQCVTANKHLPSGQHPVGNSQSEQDVKHPIGFFFKGLDISMITFNRPKRLIAIGLSNGTIHILSLCGLSDPTHIQHCHLSILHPSKYFGMKLTINDTGPIIALKWSQDGRTLAIGWEYIGPIVVSYTGRPIFVPFKRPEQQNDLNQHMNGYPYSTNYCHLSPKKQSHQQTHTDTLSSSHEPFGDFISTQYHSDKSTLSRQTTDSHTPIPSHGCSTYPSGLSNSPSSTRQQMRGLIELEWTCMDLALIVFYNDSPGIATEFPFFRSGSHGLTAGTVGCTGFDFGTSMPSRILIGSTNLLIQSSRLWDSTYSSWSSIPLPSSIYMIPNWPLRLACLSPNGDYILATGRFGLALFNVRQKRWRLLGNLQDEQSLYTEALPIGWYSHSVCYICYRSPNNINHTEGSFSSLLFNDTINSMSHYKLIEDMIRRKTYHKNSMTLLRSDNFVTSDVTYSLLFFDVRRRLDIHLSIAHIPRLNARPLKIVVFGADHCCKDSITHQLNLQYPQSIQTDCSGLLRDPLRPEGFYVDPKGLQLKDSPLPNSTLPDSIRVPSVIGVYDITQTLTAYRLMPSPSNPIQSGGLFDPNHLHFKWIVETLWIVNLSSAGWIDHPLELKFIGSDTHLFVHHINGDLTAIHLSDATPSIPSLFDPTSDTSLRLKPSRSVSLISSERDKEFWKQRPLLVSSEGSLHTLIQKEFIESSVLMKHVVSLWAGPQHQFYKFFPLPSSPLLPFKKKPSSRIHHSYKLNDKKVNNASNESDHSKTSLINLIQQPPSEPLSKPLSKSLSKPLSKSLSEPLSKPPSEPPSEPPALSDVKKDPISSQMTSETTTQSTIVNDKNHLNTSLSFNYLPNIIQHCPQMMDQTQQQSGTLNPRFYQDFFHLTNGINQHDTPPTSPSSLYRVPKRLNYPGGRFNKEKIIHKEHSSKTIHDSSLWNTTIKLSAYHDNKYSDDSSTYHSIHTHNDQTEDTPALYKELLNNHHGPDSSLCKINHSFQNISQNNHSISHLNQLSHHHERTNTYMTYPSNLMSSAVHLIDSSDQIIQSSMSQKKKMDGSIPTVLRTSEDIRRHPSDKINKLMSDESCVVSSYKKTEPIMDNNDSVIQPPQHNVACDQFKNTNFSTLYESDANPLQLVEELNYITTQCVSSLSSSLSAFWEDIIYQVEGVFVWVETLSDLLLFTVNRQRPTYLFGQKSKYTQNIKTTNYYTDEQQDLQQSIEGKDFRYRYIHLLSLDYTNSPIQIIDISPSSGMIIGSSSVCGFDVLSPFKSIPFSQTQNYPFPILHTLLRQLLTIESRPLHDKHHEHISDTLLSMNGLQLAYLLTETIKGSSYFLDLLERLLHDVVDECVPIFIKLIHRYTKHPETTLQLVYTPLLSKRLQEESYLKPKDDYALFPWFSHKDLSSASYVPSIPANHYYSYTYTSQQCLTDRIPTSDIFKLLLNELKQFNLSTEDINYFTKGNDLSMICRYCCFVYPVFRQLIRVLQLIKLYPKYMPQIFISVIRKAEPISTPSLLFAFSGLQPESLFTLCINSHQYSIVSLYLIILQNTVGPLNVRIHYLLPLLQYALLTHRFNLIHSLIHFFTALFVLPSEPVLPHKKKLLLYPLSLGPNGSPPPVVAGDSDGMDCRQASLAFIHMETLFLKLLVNHIKTFQWLKLLCVVIVFEMDLYAWLQTHEDALHLMFAQIENNILIEYHMLLNQSTKKNQNQQNSPFSSNEHTAYLNTHTPQEDRVYSNKSTNHLNDIYLHHNLHFNQLVQSFQIQFQCKKTQIRYHFLNQDVTTHHLNTTFKSSRDHSHKKQPNGHEPDLSLSQNGSTYDTDPHLVKDHTKPFLIGTPLISSSLDHPIPSSKLAHHHITHDNHHQLHYLTVLNQLDKSHSPIPLSDLLHKYHLNTHSNSSDHHTTSVYETTNLSQPPNIPSLSSAFSPELRHSSYKHTQELLVVPHHSPTTPSHSLRDTVYHYTATVQFLEYIAFVFFKLGIFIVPAAIAFATQDIDFLNALYRHSPDLQHRMKQYVFCRQRSTNLSK